MIDFIGWSILVVVICIIAYLISNKKENEYFDDNYATKYTIHYNHITKMYYYKPMEPEKPKKNLIGGKLL